MGDAQNVLMALWPGKQRQTCRGVTSVQNSVLSLVNGADIAGGPALWQELFHPVCPRRRLFHASRRRKPIQASTMPTRKCSRSMPAAMSGVANQVRTKVVRAGKSLSVFKVSRMPDQP